MNSTTVALIALGCTLGGVLLGSLVRIALPGHHVRDESKDVIKTASGLIATLVALVLGLLVASSKSAFDSTSAGLTQGAARIVLLNQILVRYGPDAGPAREELRKGISERIELLWPAHGQPRLADLQEATALERLEGTIRMLSPQGPEQTRLQAQAMQIANDLVQSRWMVFMAAHNPPSGVFLGVLIFWLSVLYTSFGLLAPRNFTVYASLLLCAASISAAMFLILEMNHPLDGVIRVSDGPMRKALEIINRP